MVDLVEPLDFALRNTRVLVRRVAVAAYRREPIPSSYGALLEELADCTDAISDELGAGRPATAVRDRLLAVGRATNQVERIKDLSAEVILGQVRSLVADLLAVTGVDPMEATAQIPRRLD